MPNLRDIQRRIASVKNTQQITRAMKMVAAAKLRRSQERIIQARPYANKMRTVLSHLAQSTEPDVHPLLAHRGNQRLELLVLTTDRGLCGAFNTNILRHAMEVYEHRTGQGHSVSLTVVGRKGRDFFRRRRLPMRRHWVGLSGRVKYFHAAEAADDLISHFAAGEVDRVLMIYNEFKSPIQQRVVVEPLLPITPAHGQESPSPEDLGEYLFEPSIEEVLAALLPRHIEFQVYRALLESAASEEGARMTAMDNATRNASEMIGTLTLKFNRARQEAITTELLDIVNGAEALR